MYKEKGIMSVGPAHYNDQIIIKIINHNFEVVGGVR